MALCCREHQANVNAFSQSWQQITSSLYIVHPRLQKFWETHLTSIFHPDSGNYYHSPLSFLWRFFPPDIPSIINCHIMKLQQRSVFFSPLTDKHYRNSKFSSKLPAALWPCANGRVLWLQKLCALYYSDGRLSKTPPRNLCPSSALNSFEMLL